MKKYLLFIILLLAVILPIKVNAKTNAEIEAILDTIPDARKVGEEYYIDLPMVDFSELEKDSLLTLDTYDAYCEVLSCFGGGTKEEQLAATNNYIKEEIETGAITVYLRSLGIQLDTVPVIDTNAKTIKIMNSSDVVRTYNYTTAANNTSIQNKASSVANQLKSAYVIRDMEYVSALYHYGSYSAIMDNGDNALFMYQEFKKTVEKNPDFEYRINSNGGGDTIEGGGVGSAVFLIKNNVIYAAKYINFNMNFIIFVDKDEPGTIKEKLQKRISDYSNGTISFELTDYNFTYTYKLDGTDYPVTVFMTRVKDNTSMPFSVIEVPKQYIKDLEISSYNYDTGISIETSGYEVPLDAEVLAEDVKESENVKKALSKFDILSAFNIDILGRIDNNKISQIKNGVEVFIPIKGFKVGATITVKHVKDDGTLGDSLKATVVEIDGKLYAKFKTTHFSTYALVEDETNPSTLDDINKYFIAAILSSTAIAGILILRKRIMN